MLVEPSRLATPHEYAPLPVRRSRNVTVGVLTVSRIEREDANLQPPCSPPEGGSVINFRKV